MALVHAGPQGGGAGQHLALAPGQPHAPGHQPAGPAGHPPPPAPAPHHAAAGHAPAPAHPGADPTPAPARPGAGGHPPHAGVLMP